MVKVMAMEHLVVRGVGKDTEKKHKGGHKLFGVVMVARRWLWQYGSRDDGSGSG